MTITDDRGVEREVRGGRMEGRHVRPVAAWLLKLGTNLFGLFFVCVGVFAGSCGASGLFLSMFVREQLVVPIALAVAVLLTVLVGGEYVGQRERWRMRVDALLSVRNCRACGYSLEGLVVEPDGCRVCPECGGAWRAGVGEAEA